MFALIVPQVMAEEETGIPKSEGIDTLSSAEEATLEKSMEKFEFQAEVNRMMDILINSLYQNKDIFLREIISNASDALDKIRFMGVKDPSQLGEGVSRDLDVRISYDEEARTITITDKGCGMTKKELIENLGTVAKSGTSAFIENMASSSDVSLIGQFGVGFYSVYLVSDKVRVISKNNEDKQYVWESSADGTFTIAEDPRGNTLGRGTRVILTLKEDAKEFLNQYRLETLIKKYSEFLTFPIYLYKSSTEEVEVPVEDEPVEETPKDETEETATEEKPKKEEKPKTKKEKKTVWEWKLINEQKAIWTRDKNEITEEEYKQFYKTISKDFKDPRTWIHFRAEGDVEFKGLLYLPTEAPPGLYDNYYSKSTAIRLYVRKVLISDKFEDLVPRYLNFIKGVLDSDDLPLNVSRETLQHDKVLRVISKKVVRKIIEMLRKLAEGVDSEDDDKKEEEEKKEEKKEDDVVRDDSEYIEFWKQFGKSIKLGVIEDPTNRNKLIKLLRYETSKSDGKFISLSQYVKNMQPWQDTIYFMAGESIESVKESVFLDKFIKKGVEVIYMTDPMDEYVVQQVNEFEGKKIQSITKEGLKFGDETDVEKRLELYKEQYNKLLEWLKDIYGMKVEKIELSTNLESVPAVFVTGQQGFSANMERIVRSQAFSDKNQLLYQGARKIMQLNPRHPLINKLKDLSIEDTQEAKDLAWVLHDSCLMNSGFTIMEPKELSTRMYRLMQHAMGVDTMELLDEIEVPEEEADDEEDEKEEKVEEKSEEQENEL